MSGPRRVLVLVGGGHAHIQVVTSLPSSAKHNVLCVLISDVSSAAYSGLVPAVVAGLVPEDSAYVPLPPLARYHGFRFVHARVIAIDEHASTLRFRPTCGGDECTLRFDVLSLDVGSATAGISLLPARRTRGSMEAFSPFVIYTRPISELMGSIAVFEDAARSHLLHSPARVVVAGGGAAGIELALALEARFARSLGGSDVTLVSRGESFAEAFGRAAGNAVLAELRRRGVRLVLGRTARLVDKETGRLLLEDGEPDVEFDCLVVATGAAPHEWLASGTNLPLIKGWVAVDTSLRVKGTRNVFAAGDCVSFGGAFGESFPPKAGVYAVREGPVLAHNIAAMLDGRGPRAMRRFAPQSSFLSLLSTGDGRGIGSKYGLVFKGTWVYRLKSYIDEGWQDKFVVPPTNDGSDQIVDEEFDGTPAEGAAILQAAEDVLTGDSFELQLGVLRKMDKDLTFRDHLLLEVKKAE